MKTTSSGLHLFPTFSVRQIAVASILGTPLAGGLLLALHHRSMGDRPSAVRTLGCALAWTVSILFVGSMLPTFFLKDDFERIFFAAVVGSLMAGAAAHLTMLAGQSTAGRPAESWNLVIGAIAFSLILAQISIGALQMGERFVVRSGPVWLSDRWMGRVTGDRLYVSYEGFVTRAEAEHVAHILAEEKLPPANKRWLNVVLERSVVDDRPRFAPYVVVGIHDPEPLGAAEYDAYDTLKQRLEQEVFFGIPVYMKLGITPWDCAKSKRAEPQRSCD